MKEGDECVAPIDTMTVAILDTATALADLIEIQPGSVVSRTLLGKPAGTITLFAFDKDQGLSEHTAPFDALVLCLDGELEIMIAGNRHRLAPGEALLMPSSKPHALRALSATKMLLTMIRE